MNNESHGNKVTPQEIFEDIQRKYYESQLLHASFERKQRDYEMKIAMMQIPLQMFIAELHGMMIGALSELSREQRDGE